MREPRLCSSPSIFHPSTSRRMYRFARRGEIHALRDAAQIVPRRCRACRASSIVGFFHGAFQPHLDRMQHAPIDNPVRHRLGSSADGMLLLPFVRRYGDAFSGGVMGDGFRKSKASADFGHGKIRERMTRKPGEALSFLLQVRPFSAVLSFSVWMPLHELRCSLSVFSFEKIHFDRKRVLIFGCLTRRGCDRSNNWW